MLRPSSRSAKPGDICMVTHWLSYGKLVHCDKIVPRNSPSFEVTALEPLTAMQVGYDGRTFRQIDRIAKLPAGAKLFIDACYLVPLDDWKDDEVTEQKEVPHGQATRPG